MQLVKQLLDAHLAARDYARAVDFAAKQIGMDRSLQTLLGSTIVNEVNRLYDEGVRDNAAQKLKDAQALIESGLKMQPALAEHYQNDLRQFQQDIRQKIK